MFAIVLRMDFKMPHLSAFFIKKTILFLLSSCFVLDILEAQAQNNCSPSDPLVITLTIYVLFITMEYMVTLLRDRVLVIERIMGKNSVQIFLGSR